jgi:hypothetical protein
VRQEGVVLRRRHRQVVVQRDVVHLRRNRTNPDRRRPWSVRSASGGGRRRGVGEKSVPGHPRRSSG